MRSNRFRGVAALFALSSLVAIVACSSSSSNSGSSSSGSSGGGSAPACSDVCAHLASVCGQAIPNCDSTCGGWSNDQRSCANGISACSGLQSCLTSGGGDSGVANDGGGGGSDSGYHCGPNVCAGCCQNNDCVDGTDPQHCGQNGGACTVCSTCKSTGSTFKGACQ